MGIASGKGSGGGVEAALKPVDNTASNIKQPHKALPSMFSLISLNSILYMITIQIIVELLFVGTAKVNDWMKGNGDGYVKSVVVAEKDVEKDNIQV